MRLACLATFCVSNIGGGSHKVFARIVFLVAAQSVLLFPLGCLAPTGSRSGRSRQYEPTPSTRSSGTGQKSGRTAATSSIYLVIMAPLKKTSCSAWIKQGGFSFHGVEWINLHVRFQKDTLFTVFVHLEGWNRNLVTMGSVRYAIKKVATSGVEFQTVLAGSRSLWKQHYLSPGSLTSREFVSSLTRRPITLPRNHKTLTPLCASCQDKYAG